MSTHHDSVVRTVSGRYHLIERLGEGGMGVVYRGFDARFERPVAIKLMRAEVSSEARARFAREARSTASVRHPHIIEVYDVGETETGEPYLVMELLQGESLASLQERLQRLPLGRALRIAEQLCEALACAHDHGLIHRDIKPENVFIEQRGGRDFVKLLDFGIAKVAKESAALTREGTFIGTLHYMAPEQLRGEPVDGRTDQYAVGGLLYGLLAGRPVFDADTVPELIHHQLMSLPEPLGSHVPEGLPPHVTSAIDRALEKDKGARFPTIRQFASVLLSRDDDAGFAPTSARELQVAPTPGSLDRAAHRELELSEEASVSLELASLKPPPKSVTRAGGPMMAQLREPMATAWRPAVPARPAERAGLLDAIAGVSGEVYKRLFVYPLITIPIYWLFIRTERLAAIIGLAIASLIGLIGLVVRAVR